MRSNTTPGGVVFDTTLGGVMWKSLQRLGYRALYLLGKQPPNAAEIRLVLDKLQSQPTPESTTPSERCDCLITAGNTTIDCIPNILTLECEAIGDTRPDVTASPLKPGSCNNIPKG